MATSARPERRSARGRRAAPAGAAPTYDARSGRYRGAGGRFLAREQVHEYLLDATDAAARRVTALADQLAARQISVADWQTQTRLALRDVHSYSAAVQVGGVHGMTPREWGHVGHRLREEYRRLEAVAVGVQRGTIATDGRFRARMRLFALAGRATGQAAALRDLIARGYDEERNVRRRGDSCTTGERTGCIEASALGWQDIGTIPLPGTRTCLGNCRCFLRRRRSSDGAVAA